MWTKTIRFLCLGGLTAAAFAADAATDDERFFEEKIRPLFAENCYACHTQTKLGGLRLDSREALAEGGKTGPAIVAGDPEASLLIRAVRHDGELKMPMGAKLPDEQIAALAEWVRRGAPWPAEPAMMTEAKPEGFQITDRQREFWSLRPLQSSAPPEVADERAVNFIDKFLFAKLAEQGLEPNTLADRRTLIRRLSLDLIGLPPTPEEVEAFVKDDAPDAYEKLVEKLLGSKAYGERWGRHWLDVVRYGEDDTRGLAKGRQGHEKYPMAHLYRDWVIQAFNDDMPFDKFVKAQLAADLMGKNEWAPKPKGVYDEDQMWGRLQTLKWDGLKEEERRPFIPYGHIVDESLDNKMLPALGLLGIGPWYYDLGDAKQMRSDERNDRVDVVTRGFLGLTVACARCHDHKYDPVSANDYYALAGVFYNSPYHEYPLTEQAIVDHWRSRDKLVEQQRKRMGDFMQKQGDLLAVRLAYRSKDYMVAAWKVAGEPKMEAARAAYEGKLDLEVLERWIAFLAKEPKHYPYLVEWQSMIAHGGSLEAAECMAENFQEKLLEVMAEFDEIDERNKKIMARSWPLDDKPPIPAPNQFKTSFEKYHIELDPMVRVRGNLYTDVFRSDLDPKPDDPMGGRKPGLLRFSDWGLESRLDAESQRHLEKLREDTKKLEKLRGDQYPFAMGVRDSDIITELPFHKRGSPTSLGDPVERRFVEVLSPAGGSKPFEKGSGRLELAEAIAAHPLTARVFVNRVWKWHFGTGIVETPSNFGQVGERPSHPELLEYLAQKFTDGGMSVKQLHRDIVLSYAYRQSSRGNDAAMAKDPENRLYWRFGRRRLDAEQIRDSLLFVSGLLDTKKTGGPAGEVDSAKFRRRTVYSRVSRFQLADYFKTFDFPNPNISASERFSTSVPQQRLFFMNSEIVYRAAAALAKRLEEPAKAEKKPAEKPAAPAEASAAGKPAPAASTDPLAEVPEEAAAAKPEKPTPPGDEERIRRVYEIVYGRPATDDEVAAGLAFLQDESNKQREDDFSEIPVTPWNQYARALLSSNEFVYLN